MPITIQCPIPIPDIGYSGILGLFGRGAAGLLLSCYSILNVSAVNSRRSHGGADTGERARNERGELYNIVQSTNADLSLVY
jgi:hypothetical protein